MRRYLVHLEADGRRNETYVTGTDSLDAAKKASRGWRTDARVTPDRLGRDLHGEYELYIARSGQFVAAIRVYLGADLVHLGASPPLTVGDLRRGDVFRWAKPYPDEDPKQAYVVLNAGNYNAQITPLGTDLNFPPINTIPNKEPVIQIHTAEEVERAARFIGLKGADPKSDLRKAEQVLLTSSGQKWWQSMLALRAQAGPDVFTEWLKEMVRPWQAREHVIRQLAWNDHNSDYFLFLEHILKTHTFSEGDTVTAEAVVDSVNSMLDAS